MAHQACPRKQLMDTQRVHSARTIYWPPADVGMAPRARLIHPRWRVGLLFAVMIVGCAPPVAAPPSPAPPIPPQPATEVRLRVADEKDLATLVAEHRGRVVLVDCWATWCGPCKEQFPHTVEMHRKLAPRGLTVVSLSCNDPDEKEAVLKFLRGQQATFDNLLSRYGASEEGFNALGIKTGAVPYYLLFDRRGKLRDDLGSGTRTEGLKREELDRAVNRLLDEKGE